MGIIIIFLLAVLFVAAVWGREAAQKLFKRGLTVAGILFALAAIGIILLAINLQAPNQAEIQRTLESSRNSAYHVPLDNGHTNNPGASLRRPDQTYVAPPVLTQWNRQPRDFGNPKIGIQLEALAPANGAKYGLQPGYGIYVKSVAPGTVAYLAGIQGGDYIAQVDGSWITDVDSLNRHNTGKRPGDIIVLRVLRGGQQYLIRVPLGNP